MLDIMMF